MKVSKLAVAFSLCMMLMQGFANAHTPLHEQIDATTARIAANPDDALLYVKRGELYRAHEDWQLALDDFHRAIDLDTSLTVVEVYIARVLHENESYSKAIDILDNYLRRYPDDPEAFLLRARTAMELKKYHRAEVDYQKAIERFKIYEAVTAQMYLEHVDALLASRKGIPAALSLLDQGLTDLEGLPVLQTRAIELELERRMPEAALRRIEALPENLRNSQMWQHQRARILEESSKITEAIAAYRQLLATMEHQTVRRGPTPATLQIREECEEALARLTDSPR